jgi:N-acetylglucosamine malate deacetylase 1
MMPEQGNASNDRRDEWLHYIQGVLRAVESGRRIPLGPSPSPLEPPAMDVDGSGSAKVVFCAPHPDDECLSGALALRLRLDSAAKVTNVAITLGSDKSKRARRLRELESACRALGFNLVVPEDGSGFEHVDERNRREKPEEWAAKVIALRAIFDRLEPDVVSLPHAHDFNTTHVGTHLLVIDALGDHLERSGRGPVLLIETEFWHQIERPNLMVGLTPEFVAAQLVAITEHGGEMERNPYHLLHPCRLMDNVRRGSEVVGGQGGRACDFAFAELYEVAIMKGRKMLAVKSPGSIVEPTAKIDLKWLRSEFPPQG